MIIKDGSMKLYTDYGCAILVEDLPKGNFIYVGTDWEVFLSGTDGTRYRAEIDVYDHEDGNTYCILCRSIEVNPK